MRVSAPAYDPPQHRELHSNRRVFPFVHAPRQAPLAVISTFVLALALCACSRAGAEDVAPAAPPLQPALTTAAPSHTAVPMLVAAAGISLVAISDHYVWQHATNSGGSSAKRLADFAQPIGTPLVLGPPLVAGFVVGRLFDRPALANASVRIGGAIGFAGVTAEALKLVVGRSRPFQVLNGDPDEMRLFSGKNSFPSGHTTVAFAAAAALDRETDSRWVPWIAYPVAGLVGWSRIHDEKHWMSDVAAGAAVGYFAAQHAENFMRSSNPVTRRFAPILGVAPDGTTVGMRVEF